MSDILHIPPPDGRVFSTGDIHGDYDNLIRALNDVNFDESSDILVTVGDLIDRGSKSLECLDLLSKPWFYSTMGNHERMMFNSVTGKKCWQTFRCWMLNGGNWWTYGQDPPYQVVKLLNYWESKLPLRIQVGKVGWVHARPPKYWDQPSEYDDEDRMLWDRSWFDKPVIVGGIDLVIVGHTPTCGNLKLQQNILYSDTGAYLEGGGEMVLTDVTYIVHNGGSLGKLQSLFG